MEKYLVTIEFRYIDKLENEDDHTDIISKKVTLGIYDDFTQACKAGNNVLKTLESKFPLNPNYNKKQRFSKNGGVLGYRKTLISNMGYLETPFNFYAKIETLKLYSVENTINSVLQGVKRYTAFKNN